MKRNISWNNCVGGALLLALGLFFVIGALDLEIGTARRMGPGYFPLVVGSVVSILAILVIANSVFEANVAVKLEIRSFAAVAAGVAAFAFLTPILGILPAVFVSVLSSSLADSRLSFKLKGVLALGVSIAIWIIFIVGLQLPFMPFREF